MATLAGWTLLLLACVSAGACAYLLGGYAFDVVRVRGAREARFDERMAESGRGKVGGPVAILVGMAHTLEAPGAPAGRAGGDGMGGPQAGAVAAGGRWEAQRLTGGRGAGRLAASMQDGRLVDAAGLSGYLDPALLPALRTRVSILLAAALGLALLPGGAPLALLGLSLGLVGGWRLVDSVLSARAADIRRRCEEELPGMLDIVALAVRAGMSLDAAVGIYCEGAGGTLSRLCARAQAEYRHGAKTREQAFSDLADRLEIPAFRRFVDTVLQSLHFGSPLAPALRALGEEVRSAHRAQVSERIAKAPVKMLIPMALLILPAMLLLVLGPVVMNVVAEMG